MKLAAIDFETANAYPESACSVGVSVFEDGIEIDQYYTLIKPPYQYGRFDWRNIRVHHIQPEEVLHAPGFDTVYERLRPYFHDTVFVAHNADFDMTVFARCCMAWGLPVPDLSYFCTVRLTQRMFPYLEHHRLNDCCEYMNIELDHHNAASDAEACALIVLNCMMVAGENDLEQFIQHCQIPLLSLHQKFEAKRQRENEKKERRTYRRSQQ